MDSTDNGNTQQDNHRKRLAAALKARRANKRRRTDSPYLVFMKDKGSMPPMVWVHPSSGFIGYYYGLADHLNPDIPQWAFQPPGMKGEKNFPDTFQGFAKLYVEILVEAYPKGPYFLGGWSNGGSIAVEMGRLLREQGRTVSMVVLIDTPTRMLDDLRGRTQEVRMDHAARTVVYMAELRGVEVDYGEAHKAVTNEVKKFAIDAPAGDEDLVFWKKGFKMLFRVLYQLGVIPDELPPSGEVYATLAAGGVGYKPEPVDFPLAFFKPEDAKHYASEQLGEWNGWEKLTPEIHGFRISGHHYTVFSEPHVFELATHLNQLLAETIEKGPSDQ